jgi:hypothetical protein
MSGSWRRTGDRGSGNASLGVFLVGVAVVACLAGYAVHKAVLRDHGSSSPAPAAAPSPDGLTGLGADAVAARLAARGLPLTTATVYTAATDPNQLLGKPGGYNSKVEFADTRTGVSPAGAPGGDPVAIGGSVEVFPDAASAGARLQRLRQLATAGGQLSQEFDYQQGAVVLRVSNYLTQNQAAGYQSALAALAAA